MAASWVSGTALQFDGASTSINGTAPAGLLDDDLLIAFVRAAGVITAPAGWTIIASQAGTDSEGTPGRLEAWQKDTVTAADSSASFTFTQTAAEPVGVTFAALRSAVIAQFSAAAANDPIYPPVLTATADEIILMAGSFIGVQTTSQSPSVVPTGSTLWTGGPHLRYMVCASYLARTAGQANSGYFALSSNTSKSNAITIRVADNAPVPAAIISADGPMAQPAVVAVAVISAKVSAPGPLAGAKLLSLLNYGFATAPGPLQSCAVAAYHDFTGMLGDSITRWVMDLITPTETVRVPISSWQATLQSGSSSYVQCVIPACLAWVDAINDATEFVIYRTADVPGTDLLIEYEMARSATEQARFNKGAQRYTCTLSGYPDAFAEDLDPPVAYDRTLTGVRSISSGSGLRVRCAVDWLLRPGHRAYVGAVPFVVRFINYYALESDSYMDVGE